MRMRQVKDCGFLSENMACVCGCACVCVCGEWVTVIKCPASSGGCFKLLPDHRAAQRASVSLQPRAEASECFFFPFFLLGLKMFA